MLITKNKAKTIIIGWEKIKIYNYLYDKNISQSKYIDVHFQTLTINKPKCVVCGKCKKTTNTILNGWNAIKNHNILHDENISIDVFVDDYYKSITTVDNC